MLASVRQTVLFVSVLVLSLLADGCTAQTTGPTEAENPGINRAPSQTSRPGIDAAAISTRLHAIAAAGRLADLRWPDFSDYRLHFQRVYDASNFAPVWVRGDQPSPQGLGMIQALEKSAGKGLNPEEYDASRWEDRVAALKASSVSANTVADFDAALTVDAMRYISDLHIGRVNPAHFKFGIDITRKKYDLPQFVITQVIHAPDVAAVLAGVEPPYDGYKRTEAALQQYELFAAKGDGPKAPEVQKTLGAGDSYRGSAELATRLHLLGDLPQGAATNPDATATTPRW